ncbi:Protein of unknown function [Pyronema omphalodes CBS 100304]|uniref:Uncharacterized protein n=1 Tax=Pyronema omphalodes (strain CBS 100304) TaxID=1076935 RepID=U4KWM0_PYROM|nr:Protein of unknown function [Pyronema omphalodes CBS 100304]
MRYSSVPHFYPISSKASNSRIYSNSLTAAAAPSIPRGICSWVITSTASNKPPSLKPKVDSPHRRSAFALPTISIIIARYLNLQR